MAAPREGRRVVGLEVYVQLLLVLLDLLDLQVQPLDLLRDRLVVSRLEPCRALGGCVGQLVALGRCGEVVAVSELVELMEF